MQTGRPASFLERQTFSLAVRVMLRSRSPGDARRSWATASSAAVRAVVRAVR